MLLRLLWLNFLCCPCTRCTVLLEEEDRLCVHLFVRYCLAFWRQRLELWAALLNWLEVVWVGLALGYPWMHLGLELMGLLGGFRTF